jgi:hypothetical protein
VASRFLHTCPIFATQILAGLLEASKTGCAKLLWGIPGCSDYVLFPPVDNARNLIDSVLYTTAHKVFDVVILSHCYPNHLQELCAVHHGTQIV